MGGEARVTDTCKKRNKMVLQIAVTKLFVVDEMPKTPLFFCRGPHDRSFGSGSRL